MRAHPDGMVSVVDMHRQDATKAENDSFFDFPIIRKQFIDSFCIAFPFSPLCIPKVRAYDQQKTLLDGYG